MIKMGLFMDFDKTPKRVTILISYLECILMYSLTYQDKYSAW